MTLLKKLIAHCSNALRFTYHHKSRRCFSNSSSYSFKPIDLMIPAVIEPSPFGGERAYDLSSRLLKDRIIYLHAPVRPETASYIIASLLYLDMNDQDQPIQFYINSPGGLMADGMAIYDTMRYIKVHTVAMGIAASMGSVLLAAGDKRFALPNSRIMIHQPLGGAQGQATDIKIVAEEIMKARETLSRVLVQHTGQSKETIERVLERDTYMSAQEAKEFGIIDEVIMGQKSRVKQDATDGDNKESHSTSSMKGKGQKKNELC